MAYVPFAPEIGAKYTLTGGDGTVATFNDSTDANYCGILQDVTGLDSADVRESGDVLVQADGGWHGNFYLGRRPIVLNGTVVNPADAADRARKLDLIRRTSLALRQDAVLSWLNNAAGSVQMQTWVRRQQPVRFSGGWVKTFQIQLVSQWAPLFSVTQHNSAAGTSPTVENQGNWASLPVITVNGATTGTVTITNTTTGQLVKFTGTLTAGQSVQLDMLNHTATRNDGTNMNQYLDFVNSTWPALIQGNNAFTLAGAPSMVITWRDTWA